MFYQDLALAKPNAPIPHGMAVEQVSPETINVKVRDEQEKCTRCSSSYDAARALHVPPFICSVLV